METSYIRLALWSASTSSSKLIPGRFVVAQESADLYTYHITMLDGLDQITIRFRQMTVQGAITFVFETRKWFEGPFTYQISCFRPEWDPASQVVRRVVQGQNDYTVYIFEDTSADAASEYGVCSLTAQLEGLQLTSNSVVDSLLARVERMSLS